MKHFATTHSLSSPGLPPPLKLRRASTGKPRRSLGVAGTGRPSAALSAQSPTSRRTGRRPAIAHKADDDTEFEYSSEAPMNAPLKTSAEAATDFVRRHIGPSPRDIQAMLESVGAKSLSELMGQTLPSSIRQKTPLDLGPRLERNRGAGAYARAGFAKPGVHLADRPGLFRHHPAGGDPAQHPGEPGLVHGLYAVSARDQPGPARGAVQLPDHDLRSHRARRRQRLAAR